MRVNVTADDIRLGVAVDPENCAVARAVKRMGFSMVSVGSDKAYVRLRVTDPGLEYKLPKTVTEKIVRHDMLRHPWLRRIFVRPFSFDMEPIPAR